MPVGNDAGLSERGLSALDVLASIRWPSGPLLSLIVGGCAGLVPRALKSKIWKSITRLPERQPWGDGGDWLPVNKVCLAIRGCHRVPARCNLWAGAAPRATAKIMRNIRLILAYDGTDFHGWQRQPEVPTIQACIEEAIQKLTSAPAQVCGSGRTDAGVHALYQVANFQTASPIPCANLIKALNDLLPPTVRVKGADDVPPAFHARYHVRSKTYRYRILQTAVCPPFQWRYVCHHPYPLDHARMAEAARLFEGEHDFTSFAAANGQDDEEEKSMVRVVLRSRLLRRPRASMLVFAVTGKGFLRYMVRNMVGTLIEVGRGNLAPGDIPRILAVRDRTQAGPTAPPQGLCLMNVEY
jgi:tRNA pseudouridine38-40 synthase